MATCSSCSQPIWWAVTDKNWRPIPIDPDPHPGGNAELIPGRTFGGAPVVTIHAQAPMVTEGVLYRTHFESCPHADRHRKRIR